MAVRQSKTDKAVKQALKACGGIISPGQHLDYERHLPKPRRKGSATHIIDGKPRPYQQLWREKNRAGFKSLSVADYCKMLSLLEMDER